MILTDTAGYSHAHWLTKRQSLIMIADHDHGNCLVQAAPAEVSVQRKDTALSQLPHVQGELRHHGSE